MGKSLVFSGSSIVLSMSYSPERLLWRTCQLSIFEGLEQYLDRYPKSGTMRNGVLYERVTSEPLIKERDGSALHIPPQCLTTDGLLPTPTKNEAHNNPGTLSQWERQGSLNVEAAKMEGYTKKTIGNNFRLSPRFVEEMMGFPIGWTELQP